MSRERARSSTSSDSDPDVTFRTPLNQSAGTDASAAARARTPDQTPFPDALSDTLDSRLFDPDNPDYYNLDDTASRTVRTVPTPEPSPPPVPPRPPLSSSNRRRTRTNLFQSDFANMPESLEEENARLSTTVTDLGRQLRAVNASGPPAAPPQRFKAPTFANHPTNDCWLAFKQSFMHITKLNTWDQTMSKIVLLSSFTGEAARAAMHLDPDKYASLNQLMMACQELFLPTAQSEMSRMIFDHAKQSGTETLLQWHARLRQLYLSAYTDAPQAPNHQMMLIRKFIFGIKDLEVQQHVLRQCPQTYNDAITSAMNETSIAQVLAAQRTGVYPVPQNAGAASGFDVSAIDPLTAVCYYCGITGHLKKDCRKMLNRFRGRSGPVRGQQRFAAPASRFPAITNQSGGFAAPTSNRGGFFRGYQGPRAPYQPTRGAYVPGAYRPTVAALDMYGPSGDVCAMEQPAGQPDTSGPTDKQTIAFMQTVIDDLGQNLSELQPQEADPQPYESQQYEYQPDYAVAALDQPLIDFHIAGIVPPLPLQASNEPTVAQAPAELSYIEDF